MPLSFIIQPSIVSRDWRTLLSYVRVGSVVCKLLVNQSVLVRVA